MLTMVTCNCNQSDLYAKTNVKASPANINNDMKIMFSKQMSQMTNTNVKCQSLPSSLHSHPIAFFLSPPIGDSFNEFQLTWVMFGGIVGSWVLSHLNNFKLKITVMFNSLSFDSQFNLFFFSSTKLWITRFSNWVVMPSALAIAIFPNHKRIYVYRHICHCFVFSCA